MSEKRRFQHRHIKIKLVDKTTAVVVEQTHLRRGFSAGDEFQQGRSGSNHPDQLFKGAYELLGSCDCPAVYVDSIFVRGTYHHSHTDLLDLENIDRTLNFIASVNEYNTVYK